MNPSIKEALIKYMKENGYTSLCNTEDWCGCGIDDLMPCMEANCINCTLGYTKPCTPEDCEQGECENRDGMPSKDCFTLTKPE